jgi:uncharacterized membrane protein (UPF0127 family)
MFRRRAADAPEHGNDNEDKTREGTVENPNDMPEMPRMQFLGFGVRESPPSPPTVEEPPLEQANNNDAEQLLIVEEPPAQPEESTVEEETAVPQKKRDKLVIILAIALAAIILTLAYLTLVLGTHTNTNNTPPQPTEFPIPSPTPTPSPSPQPSPSQVTIIPPKQLIIGDTTMNVKLAITQDEQLQGLRFTETLSPNEGMLYIMNSPDRYPFWAKDMKFPLDIIYVSQDKVVVDFAENVQPCNDSSDCLMYEPEREAQYIIEANAGFVKQHFIELNEPVIFVY